jgi:hypothetical protein
MKRAVLIGLGVAVVSLLLAAGVLYAFGTPQTPQLQSGYEEQPQGALSEQMGQQPAVRTGEVPPADPKSPLAIQIPGCVCHSDDPKLVEEHASYRMNQCAGCHAGTTPTGQ